MSKIDEKAFEAFMLAHHENGGTGLGFRKSLAAYESARQQSVRDRLKPVKGALEYAARHRFGDGDVTHMFQQALATLNQIMGEESIREDEAQETDALADGLCPPPATPPNKTKDKK